MEGFNSFGRLFIILGVLFLFIGALMFGFGKFFNFGKLPGDIVFKKGNFTFYFPIATSIILSIILSLILTILLRR